MMSIVYIIVFLLIYFAIKLVAPELALQEISTLLVGIMLLTSFLFSGIVKKISLPRLTGYMIMGAILGTSGIGIITDEIVDNLHFLENLALAFIALTAGGELRFKQVKIYQKSISYILISQIVIIFIGMTIVFYIMARFMPVLSELEPIIITGFAILFAGISLSTSPATAIGIITEIQAEGKVTDIVLIITVLKAIILILFFPVIMSLSRFYFTQAGSIDFSLILTISAQLGKSVVIGILMGAIILWYYKKVKVEMSLFLLGITLVITEVNALLELEVLLTSLVTGIVVQNFSRHGKSIISEIEIFSLPIYVIFFCFAGASIHFSILGKMLMVPIVLVLARLLFKYMGNFVGASFAKEDAQIKHHSWMGYIGQAGVALGLGIVIERNLPPESGALFFTLLISTVVMNEMLGPVLLKYLFIKVGESKSHV